MLKFFIKVFRSLYLLNMLMDQVDTLHEGRYWSEVLCSTIVVHPRSRTKKFYVKFLARLHEVHRAIAVTPVVHVPVPVCVPVPVPVRVTLALKFSRSPYLDNHSSESIHTWTIDTL